MQFKMGPIRGVEKWQAFLKDLPRGTVRTGLFAIAEWIVGNGQRGLKRYSPYKYIARKKAYGQTFSSDKQRRYVMAMIREGRIDPGVPHRTGRTQRGYEIEVKNNGYSVNVVNKEPGAYYTRDDQGQARLNKLAGWRAVSDVISTNIAGALKHARAKVAEHLRNKG